MKPMTHIPRTLAAVAVALMLTACHTAPPAPQATIEVPAAYKEAAAMQARWKAAQPAEAQPRGEWWRAFNDPTLNDLQQQAEAGNPGLAAAAARVKAARALLRGAEAGRMPQVNLQAGVSRQKLSSVQAGVPADTHVAPGSIWQAGVGASYEVDLFQRVANGVQAAEADAQAIEASQRSVRLALQADVAQAYYQLRTLDAEVDVLKRTLALREQTLGLVEKRRAAGDVSELDLARAKADRASTRAELQGLQGQRQRAEHALALLLGQTPSAFQLAPQPLPADLAMPSVPAGLPSALLERRPDVAAAQASMMAANARVGQARSALFPALVLTAQGGQASAELADLFTLNARNWLVSAVFNLPVIDGGRNKAAITRAEAALEESVAGYRQSVLQAFGDVEGQLASLGSARDQAESVDEALVAARRSTELADKRYRAGEDSFLTLLDTQRSLLSTERQSVQLRGAWASQTVGLVRALGGGW
jgi:multidrug efflux system outer membrane protein